MPRNSIDVLFDYDNQNKNKPCILFLHKTDDLAASYNIRRLASIDELVGYAKSNGVQTATVCNSMKSKLSILEALEGAGIKSCFIGEQMYEHTLRYKEEGPSD